MKRQLASCRRWFVRCGLGVLACGVLLAVVLSSCSGQAEEPPVRSMYYWRTVFSLSRAERDFMRTHGVERLYVRYFDVVMDGQGEPMPNATIKFPEASSQPPPEGALIPVVFITNDCMARRHEGLAEKILSRVLQMNETHDVEDVDELQIDCDWTITTRRNFFAFLDELRELARAKGIALSATITTSK